MGLHPRFLTPAGAPHAGGSFIDGLRQEDSMSSAPNEPRAIEEAAGYVRDTIKHFTDDERKRILDSALRELDSKLAVSYGS
jgi:hypothetical protein